MATPFATPRARALGFGLRKCREARNFGVRELARLIGVHAQELSNWEYGKRIPKVEQVALLMGVLVVEPGERARLLELARTAREPSWLEKMVPGVEPIVSTYAEYERDATAIFAWQPLLVPGLLQTDGYVRAMFTDLGLAEVQIEKLVQVKRARRSVITRYDPLPYHVVVDEAALRRCIGPPAIMLEQLRSLSAMSNRRHIRLQVLPAGGKFHPGYWGPFMILEFAQLPPIVFVEHYRASAYLYDEDQIADYRSAAKTLAGLALSEQESCALIGEVAAELGGAG
ncbi:helix-turn-helix domain-containing protein [Amycolatopsis vastitatis]|uniref:XRE family transcriptional regulator n=1 Tax=Amycolatopsis vastitatis TaxID=1905142 RepID=A0A229SN70_9PSEU|nr:helix-turn-helix transcriptional regulator [Amycolatopsis vastitatis]OXM60293.1 XRE family transcriptional regulator [Amycolatopsis vastitatis]